jgi:hypothetical protein
MCVSCFLAHKRTNVQSSARTVAHDLWNWVVLVAAHGSSKRTSRALSPCKQNNQQPSSVFFVVSSWRGTQGRKNSFTFCESTQCVFFVGGDLWGMIEPNAGFFLL